MRKLKNLEKDGEKITNGLLYDIAIMSIYCIMFFFACFVLNGIIAPCLQMLEDLAENAVRMSKAVVKIFLAVLFIVAIYKVFLER